MGATADNRPRFEVGTDHVESWFVRANDPTSPRAVWLKRTILARRDGSSLTEAWCSVFDGTRTAAFRAAGELDLGLTDDGGASRGHLGDVTWDLAFRRDEGPLGEPLSLLPTARLVDAPFPRNKLLSPFPVARFSGSLTWGADTWDLAGWQGMQGHNWGAAHSPEYAWGQCLFPEAGALVEAASGRIELGSRTSPLFSMMVVRVGATEHRFDRIVDLWRQHPSIEFPRWTLEMRGRAGRARLEMTGDPAAMVCLGYDNPTRPRSYCLNSKTARVRLEVAPREGAPFELTSEHGGALEFLQPDESPDVRPVV